MFNLSTRLRNLYIRCAFRIWNYHGDRLKQKHAAHGIETDQQFGQLGYQTGRFAPDVFRPFLESLDSAPVVRFRTRDVAKNYHYNTGVDEDRINKANIFYCLQERQLAAMSLLLNQMRNSVAACLGSNWKVVNTRYWSTIEQPEAYGANKWHTDGLPRDVLKIMIYPHAVGGDAGTTELKLPNGTTFPVEGEAGTWLIFKNSELMHRGVPPKKGGRKIIEVTVVPAKENIQKAVFAGHNAQFPLLPWFQSAS